MRKTRQYRIAVLLVSLLLLSAAEAARSADEKPAPRIAQDSLFSEVGLITGFGYSTVTEGDYLPVPVILHLGVDMKRWFPSLQGSRGVLTVFLEPQVNAVFGADTGIEAGLGIGLKYRYPLNEAFSVYGLYSTGFVFITPYTVDQANGFNFANAAGAGLNVRVMHGASLDLGVRFRHVSNADLRDPNCGIDSYFGTIGFMISY